jgi:hypothetical protein
MDAVVPSEMVIKHTDVHAILIKDLAKLRGIGDPLNLHLREKAFNLVGDEATIGAAVIEDKHARRFRLIHGCILGIAHGNLLASVDTNSQKLFGTQDAFRDLTLPEV